MNRFAIAVIVVAGALLLCLGSSRAGGLQAGYVGTRGLCDGKMTRESMVGEWCARTDAAGDLIDHGENLILQSEDFSTVWTATNASVITNSIKAPDNSLTADTIHEDGTAAASHYVSQAYTLAAGHTYTFSAWILRAGRTWGMLAEATVDGPIGSSDLTDCSTGTVAPASARAESWRSVGNWCKVSLTWTSVGGVGDVAVVVGEADNDYTFDGLDQDSLYVWGASLVDNTDGVIVGPGVYHPTGAANKPRFDLADTGAPGLVASSVQDLGGNRIPARTLDGVTDFYSTPHHDAMNINDQDHTYTFLFSQDTAATGTDMLFSHAIATTAGLYIYSNSSSGMYAVYQNGAGGPVWTDKPFVPNDGNFHVAQLVRRDGIALLYIDGDPGNPVDASAHGVDGSVPLYLGAYGGASIWEGAIAYTRIDNAALSIDELAQDRERLWGVASNLSVVADGDGIADFSRSTTAYTTFSDMSMAEIPANVPRVGGDGGGVLIEGPGTNKLLQSQDLSTTWTTTQATISIDAAIAPDGKTTVDGIVGTAITNDHGVCQNQMLLTAEPWVFHVWARPGDQGWLYLHSTTIANATAFFDIANGLVGTTGAGVLASDIEPAWGGFYHAWIVFTGTAAQHTFCIYSAEADNDSQFLGDGSTVNTYAWQAQVELGTFPTSIIPTTTAEVTRLADDFTYDPHPPNSTEIIVPEFFKPTGNATELTVEFEARCQWSGSADIGIGRRLFAVGGNAGTASWNRNVFQVYVVSVGRVTFGFYDDSSTLHFVQSGIDPVDFSGWFTIKAYVDFADLSSMDLWINSSNAGMAYSGNAGTADFDTRDTEIRFGQNNAGGVDAYCRVRNPGIQPYQF